MIVRQVAKKVLESEPYGLWNAFVDLLAMEDYDDLSIEQRPAHLVFWYESEVQNGGHLQYFENWGTERLVLTIEALGLLGSNCHQLVLKDAYDIWKNKKRVKIETVEEYCETALEEEFMVHDNRFHSCSPTLLFILEQHFKNHESSFVTVI